MKKKLFSEQEGMVTGEGNGIGRELAETLALTERTLRREASQDFSPAFQGRDRDCDWSVSRQRHMDSWSAFIPRYTTERVQVLSLLQRASVSNKGPDGEFK